MLDNKIVKTDSSGKLPCGLNTYNQVNFFLLCCAIQSDCKFRAHVNLELIKANKCLHVLRTLRKDCNIHKLKQITCSLRQFCQILFIVYPYMELLNLILISQRTFQIDIINAVLFLTPFQLRIYQRSKTVRFLRK